MICSLTQSEKLTDGFFTLRLEAPHVARYCVPGQFVMLRGLSSDWPYLRRPFSIYTSDGEAVIDIVYKVVGRATTLMSKMKVGTQFDLIGPLGKGFTASGEYSQVIALAGGIGIPPIGFYCQKYAGLHDSVTLVIGARTREELLVPIGLVVQGVGVEAYTEDGSKGTKGTVCDGLRKALRRVGPDTDYAKVIACGPREMLSTVATICHRRGIRCEVSVEEIMACGVGACLACAVPSAAGGYLHACKDGPVLGSRLIDWKRWLEQ
jgi:dihydroorotate dehydrogenase electron transfer subunit